MSKVKSYPETGYDDHSGGRCTGILTAQGRESDYGGVRLYF